ncbi:MAG: HPP family protein [SAR202 cluster bacterium]|nr:HPP family protein [SAR202 cluster bacterium]
MRINTLWQKLHMPHPHMPHPHMPKPHGFLPHILDQYFHSRWAHYTFQCLLAALSLLVILLVGDTLLQIAIVVGVASSAFTIFVVPNSVAATPRKVIGGHLVAGVIGSIISLTLDLQMFSAYESVSARYILDIAAALSVGVGIFFMVVTNTEHPPAAGTSLGLVIHGFEWTSVVFILSSAILLSIIRLILRNRMINLL